MSSAVKQAKAFIASQGGTIRTRDALAAGIHPRTLYALRDAGELVQLARGLYRLADLPRIFIGALEVLGRKLEGDESHPFCDDCKESERGLAQQVEVVVLQESEVRPKGRCPQVLMASALGAWCDVNQALNRRCFTVGRLETLSEVASRWCCGS